MPSTRLPWEITLAGTGGGSCLLMEPNGVDARPVQLSVDGEEVSVPSGAGFLDKTGARPATRFEFEYITESREETAFLRSYFDSKLGRAIPFWFPTWVKEINVSSYFDPLDLFGHTWFVSEGYAASIWPLGAAYRRVIYVYGKEYSAARISSVALNSPSAGIEQIVNTDGTVSAGFGSATTRPFTEDRGYQTLSLRFGRFDTDVFSMVPHADGRARITLPIVELPDEAVESP